MIEIDDFSKKFGKKVAVEHLNFTVETGSICGFIGHNGAGKTTTLRALSGILPFQEGDIRIYGHSIQKEPIKAKKILAYVPDNPDIYDFMTGLQFIHFICDAYQIPKQQRESRIVGLAESFQLESVLQDNISSYSHGMKQKLVLISALVHRPKALILDEPFVGLDPKASNTLKHYMRELVKEGGSILYSTHVLEVAETLCDTLAILKEGKLVAHGKTQTLLENSSLETLFLELNLEENP